MMAPWVSGVAVVALKRPDLDILKMELMVFVSGWDVV